MAEGLDIRRERIERLLDELEYEVTRGVMEREIEPDLSFQKLMPGGPAGTVGLAVYLRPVGREEHFPSMPSRLRVVGGSEGGDTDV